MSQMHHDGTKPCQSCGTDGRRGFLKKALATIIGAITVIVPAAAGLAVIFDPLRRKGQEGSMNKVATLDAVPNDGIPRKFSVLASKVDAWTKTPNIPVGAVYIRRTGDKKVEVLNVECPHAGCFVDFVPSRKGFFCPCHNSVFGPDGKIADSHSPSPRDLDSLEWEIRNDKEIWVKFQSFRAGHKEKLLKT